MMIHQRALTMMLSALCGGCLYKVESNSEDGCSAADSACDRAIEGGVGGSGSEATDPGGDTAGGASGGEGGAESGAADGGSGGATGSDDPTPTPTDFTRFTGQRTFSVDAYGDTWDCYAEAVPERGSQITEGADHSAAAALCPSCELIYAVRPSAESACAGWVPLPNPSVRMLDLDEGVAKVYSMSESRGEYSLVVLDEGAEFDGFVLSYAYRTDWSYGSTLSVVGEMIFPELPPD